MNKLKPAPYIICALVVSALGILIIPFTDTLRYPGTTYAEGFSSAATYIFAFVLGISFAFSMYRYDKRRYSDAGASDDDAPETDCGTDNGPGSEQNPLSGNHG